MGRGARVVVDEDDAALMLDGRSGGTVAGLGTLRINLLSRSSIFCCSDRMYLVVDSLKSGSMLEVKVGAVFLSLDSLGVHAGRSEPDASLM